MSTELSGSPARAWFVHSSILCLSRAQKRFAKRPPTYQTDSLVEGCGASRKGRFREPRIPGFFEQNVRAAVQARDISARVEKHSGLGAGFQKRVAAGGAPNLFRAGLCGVPERRRPARREVRGARAWRAKSFSGGCQRRGLPEFLPAARRGMATSRASPALSHDAGGRHSRDIFDFDSLSPQACERFPLHSARPRRVAAFPGELHLLREASAFEG